MLAENFSRIANKPARAGFNFLPGQQTKWG
jgi:hypothetical protein